MDMDERGTRDLYAKAIGDLVMAYCEKISPDLISRQAESNALALIAQIRAILNNESLSDPACFQQIDAIISAFYRAGLSTSRHWEAE